VTRRAEVREATNNYRDEQDSLGPWLAACCERDSAAVTPVAKLYESYCGWCMEQGEDAMTSHSFGDALTERGITGRTARVGGKPAKVRTGIRLVALVSSPHG
jgi:putative DNA primase/helicase